MLLIQNYSKILIFLDFEAKIMKNPEKNRFIPQKTV